MRKRVFIKNHLSFKTLELEFGSGLNVLTGETGAGKSILMDALALALGARSDTGLIRHGCERAPVIAEFTNYPTHINALLQDNGIDISDTLTLRRILNTDGKSKAWINDTPVSIKILKIIGDEVVEIHGQFANHTLLNPATHINALDTFALNTIENFDDTLNKTKKAFAFFEITNQMLNPKIKIVSSSKLVEFNLQTIQDYIEIGGRVEPSSKYYLLNYQFSESVNNFSGSFSVTIYEDIDTDSKECIFSRVKNLDVVFIYENSESQDFKLEKNNPVFIGVVHSKNIRTMMNNGKVSRTTTLSGNSICSLIGDLSVSLDIHSLTGVEAVKVQKDFTEEIKSKIKEKYPNVLQEYRLELQEIESIIVITLVQFTPRLRSLRKLS